MKKLSLLVIITAVFGLGSGAAQATVKDELRIGVQSFISTLDPQAVESNAAAQVLYNLYDTLIMRVPTEGKLTLKPGLALSWKQTNPTTWDFKLRPGVKFHDGTDFTADDVVFSLRRAIKRTDPRYSSTIAKFFNNFDDVVAVDPLTVRITTLKPDPLTESLLSDPNTGIVSKATFEKLGLDKAGLAPVSTGPYQVTQFVPGTTLVLERFDGFWGPKAPFKKVTYKTIPEIASRITALTNNEVDFIVSIPPDQEATFNGNPSVKLVGTVWPMFHAYVLNMSNPVLASQKLRLALNLGIDREALVKALWLGKGKVPTSMQFANYGAPLYMADLQTIKYDPKAAAQLVKESGYDGTPIVISNQTNYYTYADLAAQAIIEMWKKIGVNAQLNQVDSFPKDLSGLMIRTWSNPLHYPDPMGLVATHWTTFSWPATSKFFTPDEDWNKLYEQARFTTDVTKRQTALRNLVLKAQDLSGFIYLYQPYESFAMKKEISWDIPKAYRPYTLTLRSGDVSVK